MDNNTKNVMFSSKSDIWSTPKELYDKYINDGCFDPCPIDPQWDGLEIEWKEKNFVNPPYSDISSWVDKSIDEVIKNNSIVYLLVPSRTDTKWFHKLMNKSDIHIELNFIKGRLKFGTSKNSAPFPSVIIYISNTMYNDWHFGKRPSRSVNKQGRLDI